MRGVEKEQVVEAAVMVMMGEGLKKEDKGRRKEEEGEGDGGSGRGRREVESNSKRHCKLGVSVGSFSLDSLNSN